MKRIAKSMGAAVLAALLLAVGAGPGFGKPILDEDFGVAVGGAMKGGKVVIGKDGKRGWSAPGGDDPNVKGYIEYDLKEVKLNAASGTIEFRLTRDDLATSSDNLTENLVALQDAKGEPVFTMQVQWLGWGPFEGRPTFWFNDAANDSTGLFRTTMNNLNYPGSKGDLVTVVPGPAVARGETVHIALTWGTKAQDGLWINGQRITGGYTSNNLLPKLIPQAVTMLVGAETSRSYIPNGSWSMTRSIIHDFRVHDRVLAPQEFAINPSAIGQVTHDASSVAGYSGALVEGDELTVALNGAPGGKATFDIGRRASRRGEIPLDWRGYYDEDVNVIDLDDVTEYRVYTSPVYFTLEDVAKFRYAKEYRGADLGGGVYAGITEVKELRARDRIQQYTLTGLDLDATTFVMVTAVDSDAAAPFSFTDASGAPLKGAVDLEEGIIVPIGNLPLNRVDGGSYRGVYTVGGDLTYPIAVIVAHLTGADERASTTEADETFAIDTSVRILVKASPSVLKADEKSTSRLTVELRNANGDTVSGHKVALSIATTSEYTGVIGGGKLRDAVGGALALDFSGETDAFGTVQATFTAGFAAKTAIIVARDLATSDVGTGFVQQYIEGSTDIELVGLRPSAAKSAGYSISVTTDKEWLTADGSSQAKIKAQVMQNGKPVAGHTVVFSVVGQGRIKTVNAVTDATGAARAVYTAGTKIGLVLVKATDVTIGLSGSVQIELRSDAPAKIAFTVDVFDPVALADSSGKGLPELYADGRSTAGLTVLITDINDNPNADTTVTYAVTAGSGSLEKVKSVTNKDGKSYATFKAGLLPGTATVKVTVSSNVPSATDTAAAENAVLTVPDFEFITE
jgi:hypothetical protein